MPSELVIAVRRLTNLERAWSVIQSNGRTSSSEKVRLELDKFADDAPRKIRSIKGKLSQGSFRFMPAEGIPIPKVDARGKKTGKFRPIVLAPVESRIVQRAILNVLVDAPGLTPYINTPYSFGGIRGTSYSRGNKRDRSEFVSAVPAAIRAVLSGISDGARFVASADIQSFFTRISKGAVTKIVSDALNDEEMVSLFRDAIEVELSNLARLREFSKDFPIEDIGVAQGNSLSPLLGNLILSEFDKRMNEGDCICIRYIDDFIILAPTKKAADARLRKAIKILSDLGMELSPEKSSKGGVPIEDGFDFLGINICPGAVRPSSKAQAKIVNSVQTTFNESLKAMRGVQNGQPFNKACSLVSTFKRVDGMIDGWGKHYWFCNDKQIFENVDKKIDTIIRLYLNNYEKIRNSKKNINTFLGISKTVDIHRDPFAYPKLGKKTKN